jgi:RNA polymerase sigma-70 factor (ECF subfamily)
VTLHGGDGDHGLSRNRRAKRLEGMEEHQARIRSAGEVHAELRPLLFSIAYRMLGSVAEAEDVVQEAFLRWHRALEGGTEVESPKAYLAAVTTRLAIDHLRAARSRRESYAGPWLPEPLVTETEADVAQHAEMADSLSMAFLILLENLSPVERAVFLLREVFEYGYGEIGQIVGKSEANSRQIFARARRRIEIGTPRFEASTPERDELVRRFFAACEQGDMEGLVDLLTADAVFTGDGGGKAQAFKEPIHGRERVARLLLGLFARGARLGARVRLAELNGQPGAIGLDAGGRVINVFVLDVSEGRVQAVRSVVNPDKLGHLGPVSDVARLDRPAGS